MTEPSQYPDAAAPATWAHPVDIIAPAADESAADEGSLREQATAVETEQAALPGRQVRVHLTDGTSFDVRLTNRDYIAWDMTRPKRKWPHFQDAPFLFSTFLAWSAGRRDGHTTALFDVFVDTVEAVVNLSAGAEDDARPTR